MKAANERESQMRAKLDPSKPYHRPKLERFCQLASDGIPKTQALKEAGLSQNMTNFLRKPGVKARLDYLTQQKTQELRERVGISRDKEGLVGVLWQILLTPAGHLTKDSEICQKWETLPGGTKVAMPDKLAAASLLARMQGYLEPEKSEVSVSGLDGIIRRVLKKS